MTTTLTKEKNRLLDTCSLFAEFVLCSFIGWTYETVLMSIVSGKLLDRGLLHIPICPIYGFGFLLLLLCLRKVKGSLMIFIIGAIATTVLELVSSYLIDYFLGYSLWNYDHFPLNFEGRVCLTASLAFGFMCVIYFQLIRPKFKRIIAKVPQKIMYISCLTFFVIIMIDLCLSV